jgi:dGTPase
LPGLRPPLEAQLIDLCDEIAYNAADLDDGYSAGLVTVEEACASVAAFREFYEAADMQFPGSPERVRVHEVVRGLINWLVSSLMEGSIAACAGLTHPEAVREHPRRVACLSPAAAVGTRELKQFLRRTVYSSDAVTHSRSQFTGRIAALFEFFLQHPGRMPAAYQAESAGQPLHHRVCDYIAGMTDGFFLRTCEQFGILT